MKNFVRNYNYGTAPSILVPYAGHIKKVDNLCLSTKVKNFKNAREVLARDIFELRRVYPDIPNKSLQELINLNKSMYPNAFKK